jgi:hypothetical protein
LRVGVDLLGSDTEAELLFEALIEIAEKKAAPVNLLVLQQSKMLFSKIDFQTLSLFSM